MTCATRPHPMTPTLSRLAITTPMIEFAGTFHGPYTKGLVVSTLRQRGGKHRRRFRDAFLRCHERVFVLDGQRVYAAAGDQLVGEGAPPHWILPSTDDSEVPRHLFGRSWPAPVEQAVDREVVPGEHHVFSVAVAAAVPDPRHDRERIHTHPEEVARVDVGRDRV